MNTSVKKLNESSNKWIVFQMINIVELYNKRFYKQ
jgi:hypothetical protein